MGGDTCVSGFCKLSWGVEVGGRCVVLGGSSELWFGKEIEEGVIVGFGTFVHHLMSH